MSREVPDTALSRGPAGSFPELAARHLEEYLEKIELAVARMDDDELWWRPAPGTNSAANLLLHLRGNLSLWVLAGLGGEEYRRDRSGEFAARPKTAGGAGATELLAALAEVVARCRRVLESLAGEDLGVEVEIQGYRVDRMAAIFHAAEHMSYHTGQIVWIAKQLLPEDAPRIEFYPRHSGE